MRAGEKCSCAGMFIGSRRSKRNDHRPTVIHCIFDLIERRRIETDIAVTATTRDASIARIDGRRRPIVPGGGGGGCQRSSRSWSRIENRVDPLIGTEQPRKETGVTSAETSV